MKKIFAMLAAILFCGSMMVSCSKDDDNTTDDPQFPTKTDMAGTWTGTYQGTAEIDDNNENYTVSWTLQLNPEGSPNVGSLSYTASVNGMEDVNNQVVVNNYYTLQNTTKGRICLTGGMMAGIVDEMIDFYIDLGARTMTGTLQVSFDAGEMVTLGGETTLRK